MATIEKRITKSGEEAYRVKIRIKGMRPLTQTFTRKEDAKRWAKHTETEIEQGRYLFRAEAQRHTLREAIQRYRSEVFNSPSRKRVDREAQLRWWEKELGDFTLDKVTPSLLSECKSNLLGHTIREDQKRSPASANRYLAALSHVFTYACNEWEWVPYNPVRKVKKLAEPRGRVRFLSEEEIIKLLTACRESRTRYLYSVVVLAISTGMRKREILGIKRSDVDLKNERIILQHTKNGEQRSVPIKGRALECVRAEMQVHAIHSNLLFPGLKGDQPPQIDHAWYTALERSKIADFRFHDLRHTAASYLAMNNASTRDIAEILGHKTLSMARRYAHLSDSYVSGVVESMNNKIFSNLES